MLTPTEHDLNVLALTVWAEARGEPSEGIKGVIWVIRNRWEHPRWWSKAPGIDEDDTLAAVCRAPRQFSCWNTNDPNYKHLTDPKTLNDDLVRALRVLCKACLAADRRDDPTHYADHSLNWMKTKRMASVMPTPSFSSSSKLHSRRRPDNELGKRA